VKALGLMSGTSLDGIDAALLDLDRVGGDVSWSMIASTTMPYPADRRERIRSAITSAGPAEICRLHADLGEWFAEAALGLLEESGVAAAAVDVVGSHGQTIWHAPPDEQGRGATLQIGCAATLAERTGIPVVSDFRSRDVAAGGHGAPLVPFADSVLFGSPGQARALQNLGGMANVTWLGPAGDVFAFDTGPGNALMDYAAERATDGAERCDRDGRLAAAGTEDRVLLGRLLAHPFFAGEPPKSTGREVFGEHYVDALAGNLPPGEPTAWADLIATLTRLTARAIGEAYRAWVIPRGLDEVFLLGGGSRNPTLVDMIGEELDGVPVRDGSELGVDPDAREAAAFAVLAWAHVEGQDGNVPGATGAAGGRVLGSLTPGDRLGRR